MSKKDLTKLSQKQLESMLAKKYGVDKYLNQRSQLLDLLGTKGETDIQSGFTGPETEALSIMLENIMTSNKAEGGIVALLGGGSVIGNPKNTRNGILGLWTGSDEDGEGVSEAAAASAASEASAHSEDTEGNYSGTYSGDSQSMGIDSNIDDMQSIQAGLEATGPADIGGDESDYVEEARQERIEEQTKEDPPLSQSEIDYYTRGMGTATKPLKSLGDVNAYMSALVGTTASPTGAKLSEDKKFLILPNGKVINLMTGKVQESMSGLELFAGGRI